MSPYHFFQRWIFRVIEFRTCFCLSYNFSKVKNKVHLYFEIIAYYTVHNKVDRSEFQIRKNLHKGTETKMPEKLNNLTEKKDHLCSCAFVQIFVNLEFIPINFIVFKVAPVQV